MLTGEMLDQFDEQGYIIVRNVIEQKVLDGVRRDLNWLVNMFAGRLIEDGMIQDPYLDEPFERRMLKMYESCLDRAPNSFRAELHLPGLYPLFFHPVVLDLAEAMLGPEVRLYPNYTARPKLPRHPGTEVLWHQDGGYTEETKTPDPVEELSVADLHMVNVWAPLVPARPENGCMQFIPGTHKLGVVDHVQRKYYLEVVEKEIQSRIDQAVDVECDPGDVVLFSNMLFHRGQPNVKNIVRWSLDWRYQEATQPTLRRQQGHLARSRTHPDRVVRTAAQWSDLMLS